MSKEKECKKWREIYNEAIDGSSCDKCEEDGQVWRYYNDGEIEVACREHSGKEKECEKDPTEAVVKKSQWELGYEAGHEGAGIELEAELKANTERVREEMLDAMTFDDMIDWWLKHYKGMEHMSADPETFYTITSILERCFKKLKNQ